MNWLLLLLSILLRLLTCTLELACLQIDKKTFFHFFDQFIYYFVQKASIAFWFQRALLQTRRHFLVCARRFGLWLLDCFKLSGPSEFIILYLLTCMYYVCTAYFLLLARLQRGTSNFNLNPLDSAAAAIGEKKKKNSTFWVALPADKRIYF